MHHHKFLSAKTSIKYSQSAHDWCEGKDKRGQRTLWLEYGPHNTFMAGFRIDMISFQTLKVHPLYCSTLSLTVLFTGCQFHLTFKTSCSFLHLNHYIMLLFFPPCYSLYIWLTFQYHSAVEYVPQIARLYLFSLTPLHNWNSLFCHLVSSWHAYLFSTPSTLIPTSKNQQ